MGIGGANVLVESMSKMNIEKGDVMQMSRKKRRSSKTEV